MTPAEGPTQLTKYISSYPARRERHTKRATSQMSKTTNCHQYVTELAKGVRDVRVVVSTLPTGYKNNLHLVQQEQRRADGQQWPSMGA